MDDDDWSECTPPSVRLRFIDLAVIATTLLRDVAQDVADACELLSDVVIGHANHQLDQRIFATEAALEIERLTGE